MCVATPGRVLSIDGDTARVDFSGNIISVNISLVDAGPGDYVLTHAGMAIEKLDPASAQELMRLFEEIGAYEDIGH